MTEDEHNNESETSGNTARRRLKKPLARRIVVAVAFLGIGAGILFNTGIGTISSLGWDSIVTICPLGALEVMVASRTLLPQGLIFIAIAAITLILLGKYFCSWICPIPSIRGLFDTITHRTPKLKTEASLRDNGKETVTLMVEKPLSRRELQSLKNSAAADPEAMSSSSKEHAAQSACAASCGACENHARSRIDSRHLILGGSLLSAAVFGFPVFCLICPIGLTFACVIVVVQLFGSQTLSWGLFLFPLMLVLELTVLRKWCLRFCPMGALASLLSLPNRLFRPKVDMEKCLRSKEIDCRICTSICPEELDPHTKQSIHECSKCRDCAVNCPVGAISFPLVQKSLKASAADVHPQK